MPLSKKSPIVGPDGLPASEVGPWVADKHKLLREYLRFHAHPRRRWLNDSRKNGAAYIDLFCGAGMARVEDTTQFVDGSPVVAWKASRDDGAPFSKVVIADKNASLRTACAERLRKLDAPVVEIEGTAAEAAQRLTEHLSPHGLHVAFLDPFSLGALSIGLIRSLAKLHHVDVLAHVSAMDLFRNFPAELKGERSEFDDFAPGWREHIPAGATDEEGRRAVVEYWKKLVGETGLDAEPRQRQIRNSVNRDLYWLILIASAKLAGRFWDLVLEYDTPQTGFKF
jgi:three-Cys-motif partner protein